MVVETEDAVYPHGDQANYDLNVIRQRLNVITEAQLAELLSIKPQTLAVWRTNGTGPSYCKPAGKTVLYKLEHVDQWLTCKVVQTNRTLEARE